MIQRFRHKGLERLFANGDTGGVDAQLAAKLRRMLILLDKGKDPSALDIPGYRLHQLKGDRRGQWAASVSGNWRLVFEFQDGHATNVDLVDYHGQEGRPVKMHKPPHPGEIIREDCLKPLGLSVT